MTKSWEEAMWAELEAHPKVDQITLADEWGIHMSRQLLTALARHRRLVIVALIDSGEYTYTTLADTLGVRVQAVKRLAEDGRAILKQEAAHAR